MADQIEPGQRYALDSGRFVRVVSVKNQIVDCEYLADRADPFAPARAEVGVWFSPRAFAKLARFVGDAHA